MDIALIEDSESDIFAMQRLFKKMGILDRVKVLRDGEQALAYFQTQPPLKLALVDLNLPGMNGGQLVEWMREQSEFDQSFIAILSTSSPQHDQRDPAQRLENDYWQKPDDLNGFAELKVKIQACLNR